MIFLLPSIFIFCLGIPLPSILLDGNLPYAALHRGHGNSSPTLTGKAEVWYDFDNLSGEKGASLVDIYFSNPL